MFKKLTSFIIALIVVFVLNLIPINGEVYGNDYVDTIERDNPVQAQIIELSNPNYGIPVEDKQLYKIIGNDINTMEKVLDFTDADYIEYYKELEPGRGSGDVYSGDYYSFGFTTRNGIVDSIITSYETDMIEDIDSFMKDINAEIKSYKKKSGFNQSAPEKSTTIADDGSIIDINSISYRFIENGRIIEFDYRAFSFEGELMYYRIDRTIYKDQFSFENSGWG